MDAMDEELRLHLLHAGGSAEGVCSCDERSEADSDAGSVLARAAEDPDAPFAVSLSTRVEVVCREWPRVRAVSGLVWRIDAFLCVASVWTFSDACVAGFPGLLRLLPRIAALDDDHGVHPLFQRSLFTDALVVAVQRADLPLVQWLVERYLPDGQIRQAVKTAAVLGRLEILQWMHTHHRPRMVWLHEEVQAAARNGHFETAKWLHDHVLPIRLEDKRRMLVEAMRSGSVDVAEWLFRLDLPFVEPDVAMAARHGHVDVMKWAQLRLGTRFDERHMNAALGSAHLKLAKWLRLCAGVRTCKADVLVDLKAIAWALQHLEVRNTSLLAPKIDDAAAAGRLDIIQLIHTHCQGRCSARAMDIAARTGRLDIVLWLHEHRTEGCTTAAMDGAAANGHFEALRWLHDHRSEGCTSNAMDNAAMHGRLEIVQWLHGRRTEGCTTNAMDYAAGRGHLDTVRWLHEHRTEGCTPSAMDNAAAAGFLHIVKWLHTHRVEGCTTAAMQFAACNHHLDVVQWLHENRAEGCLAFTMDMVASDGDLEMLQWLHANRTEGCTVQAMNGAARSGHLEVVQWLHHHRTEGCTEQAMNQAAANGHVAVLEWLHEHRNVGFGEEAICLTIVDNFAQIDALKWLLRHVKGDSFSTRAVLIAVRRRHFDATAMLCHDGRFPVAPSCFGDALRLEEFELFQWLVHKFASKFPDVVKRVVNWKDPYERDAMQELAQLERSGELAMFW